MNIRPDFNPFASFSVLLSTDKIPPVLKVNEREDPPFNALVIEQTPMPLASREVAQLEKEISIPENAHLFKENLGKLKNKEERNYSDIVEFIGIQGSALLVSSLVGKKLEEIEKALAESRLGRLETDDDNVPVFKFPKQTEKELEFLGITSIELQGLTQVQTYTSFKFQTLSDKEVDLLITQVKAYIVYLKVNGDPSDKKTEKAIQHQEFKLKYLELEKTIRTNNPEKIELIVDDLVDTSVYKTTKKMEELFAIQKAIQEKQEAEADQKFWETKHVIILKEIMKVEVHRIILKTDVLNDSIDSHNIVNGYFYQSQVRTLVNMSHFINLTNL